MNVGMSEKRKKRRKGERKERIKKRMVNSPVQTLLYSENSPNPDLMVVCHRPWSNPPTSIMSGLRAEQSIIITLASDLDLRCFLSMLQLIHIWKNRNNKD